MNWREASFSKIFCFNLPQLRQATWQLWLTYRSCSVDDRCHCGQGSCIPFQAFMGTLKWQRLLRPILSWTPKKSLNHHLAHTPSYCEDASNILAQTLLSLLEEAFYSISLLLTVFSFIKSCYLNHRSQEAFCSAHCGFTHQGQHFSFALCCQGCFHSCLFPC